MSKQYGLSGVAADVELGKKGATLQTSNAVVDFRNPSGDLMPHTVKEAEQPDEAVALSQLTNGLGGKQNALSIHQDSVPYLELIGDSLRLTNLGIIRPVTNDTHLTLAEYIAANDPAEMQEGDTLFLTAANPLEVWMKGAGTTGTEADFLRVNTDSVSEAMIRQALSAGPGISYNQANGQISASVDGTSVGTSVSGALEIIDGAIGADKLATTVNNLIDSKAPQAELDAVEATAQSNTQLANTKLTALYAEFNASNNGGAVELGVLPSGYAVYEARVSVTQIFDAAEPKIAVGSATTPNLLLDPSAEKFDLKESGVQTDDLLHVAMEDSTVSVRLTDAAGTAGAGMVLLLMAPVLTA